MIDGGRGRKHVAMLERTGDRAPIRGIGLGLNEVKSVVGRLQQIVAAEQTQESVSTRSMCVNCRLPLPRKGSGNLETRLNEHSARDSAALPISTKLAESAAASVIGDRFKENTKMRRTQVGANAVLHVRVANRNGELATEIRLHSRTCRCANHECFANAA